jgi:hypothetical protein
MRDRTEPIQGNDDRRDRGRRDDDDDGHGDRDRRGRAPSSGWRDKLRRSLSRTSRDRDGGGSRQDNGRQRDRSSNQGRRRAAAVEPVLQLAVPDPEHVSSALPVTELGMPRPAVDQALRILAGSLARLELGAPRAGLSPTSHRGRSRARSASPRASRRHSRAVRTPPGTPESAFSPSAVCPASPSSKGSCPPVLLLSRGDGLPPSCIAISPFTASSASAGARRTLDLIAPTSSSISRPPGFEGSPRS